MFFRQLDGKLSISTNHIRSWFYKQVLIILIFVNEQLMIPNHDFMMIFYHIKWGWFHGSKCCVISCWSKEKQGEGARFQRGEGEGEKEGGMFSTIDPGHTIMHSYSMARNRTQVHPLGPYLTLYALSLSLSRLSRFSPFSPFTPNHAGMPPRLL